MPAAPTKPCTSVSCAAVNRGCPEASRTARAVASYARTASGAGSRPYTSPNRRMKPAMASGGHVASQAPCRPTSAKQRRVVLPAHRAQQRRRRGADVVVSQQGRDRGDARAAVGDQHRVESGGRQRLRRLRRRLRRRDVRFRLRDRQPARPSERGHPLHGGRRAVAVRRIGLGNRGRRPGDLRHRRAPRGERSCPVGVLGRQRGEAGAPLRRGVAHDALDLLLGPEAQDIQARSRHGGVVGEGDHVDAARGRDRGHGNRRATVERADQELRAGVERRAGGGLGPLRLVAGVARQQLEIGPADVEQRQLRRIQQVLAERGAGAAERDQQADPGRPELRRRRRRGRCRRGWLQCGRWRGFLIAGAAAREQQGNQTECRTRAHTPPHRVGRQRLPAARPEPVRLRLSLAKPSPAVNSRRGSISWRRRSAISRI